MRTPMMQATKMKTNVQYEGTKNQKRKTTIVMMVLSGDDETVRKSRRPDDGQIQNNGDGEGGDEADADESE